ncbi:hypothetical protein P152DRAFT_516655 [Eremomyces bilateralis CBS 781.70]|uniref:Uncharacterized protein n=1 Tax=Eremomyces bilateralis CBS 781.70 TaxID=1392243 RepID=A0A6G1FUA5_9PEZI|nr:uncharacterized protein P152DRAFT_516655 [Eremomyces bilateralis CBS 781.70]KAF1809475.1 hypothetical protein P152DRAFT_516655 [Eremomyces bilateralis CBS 781.70]
MEDLDDMNDIEDEILRRANGIIMWVVIVVSLLNKAYDEGRIEAMPEGDGIDPNSITTLSDDASPPRPEACSRFEKATEAGPNAGPRAYQLQPWPAVRLLPVSYRAEKALSEGVMREAIVQWLRKQHNWFMWWKIFFHTTGGGAEYPWLENSMEAGLLYSNYVLSLCGCQHLIKDAVRPLRHGIASSCDSRPRNDGPAATSFSTCA